MSSPTMISRMSPIARRAAVVVLAAAATLLPPRSRAQTVNDPFEASNRAVFKGNQFIRSHILAPAARGTARWVPDSARIAIHNFADNCDEPIIAANDLLQGRFDRASVAMRRFALNTSIGIGGLRDVASERGFLEHSADFGQTLGVWGVAAGPSIQLPLLGPSNLRDTVGQAANSVANPGMWVTGGAAIAFKSVGAVKLVDKGMGGAHVKETEIATAGDAYLVSRDDAARRRELLVADSKAGVRRDPSQ